MKEIDSILDKKIEEISTKEAMSDIEQKTIQNELNKALEGRFETGKTTQEIEESLE